MRRVPMFQIQPWPYIYARMSQCEVLVIAVNSPASTTHFHQPRSNLQAINEENSLRGSTFEEFA